MFYESNFRIFRDQNLEFCLKLQNFEVFSYPNNTWQRMVTHGNAWQRIGLHRSDMHEEVWKHFLTDRNAYQCKRAC